jgi:FPC/CPF motif-containing protein YcgG
MQAENKSADAVPSRKREVSDWRARVILEDEVGLTEVPHWLVSSYETLRSQVLSDGYPCFFGTIAERRGEMFYSYVNGKDLSTLPATMATFARLADQVEFRRHNIAIFFEPDAQPLSHEEYHDHFWGALQHLHNVDKAPGADFQPDPSDEAWEFSFGGVQMFVVCACPSFQKRHSRNLGPGMVLLFQPRAVFVDTITNKVIGREARNQVRERLRVWDEVEPHPDLGFYGDPGNLEWKQYFLADDSERAADRCPFLSRKRKNAAQAAQPVHSTTQPAETETVEEADIEYSVGK